MIIRCLVADDEPLARRLISEYIARVPHLTLAGTCRLATEIPGHAGGYDLLFLDIRMPGLTGIEYLRACRSHPPVILTTAYSEYALEGFELDVVDYLVKPVTFERFLLAVNRATHRIELEQRQYGPAPNAAAEPADAETQHRDYLFVKSGYKSVRINFDEILYVEGMKEYVTIHTADGRKYVRLAAMKEMERILPNPGFLRIHKSYIVSVRQISAAYGNTIEVGKASLPVGRIYKEEVARIIS